jgi:hypothetical protein
MTMRFQSVMALLIALLVAAMPVQAARCEIACGMHDVCLDGASASQHATASEVTMASTPHHHCMPASQKSPVETQTAPHFGLCHDATCSHPIVLATEPRVMSVAELQSVAWAMVEVLPPGVCLSAHHGPPGDANSPPPYNNPLNRMTIRI